ncbi:LOW QUALITY PROTEIN: conserved hypothetical protein, partial [Streptomyces sp. SPB78]
PARGARAPTTSRSPPPCPRWTSPTSPPPTRRAPSTSPCRDRRGRPVNRGRRGRPVRCGPSTAAPRPTSSSTRPTSAPSPPRPSARPAGSPSSTPRARSRPRSSRRAAPGSPPSTAKTGDVVLAAADLGALTRTDADARYLTPGSAPVVSVNGQTGAVVLAAADLGAVTADEAVLLTGNQTVAGSKTFSAAPATTADPTSPNHLVRRSYVESVAASGVWTPAGLGFKAWAYDPATSSASNAQYCINGNVYFIGIPLTSPGTITNVCFYVPGYVGGTLAATSYAGLYTSAGKRVGVTGTLDKLIGKTSGGTFVLKLSTPYTATAGNYWVALLVNGPDPKGNGPAFLVGASMGDRPGGGARVGNAFQRYGRHPATGQTSLPEDFTPSTIIPDANAIWAAVS